LIQSDSSCSAVLDQAVRAAFGYTTFQQTVRAAFGYTTFQQTIRAAFGYTTFQQTVRAAFGYTTFQQTVRAAFGYTTFQQTIRAAFGYTTFQQTVRAAFGYTTFNQTIRAAFSDDGLRGSGGESVSCKNRECNAEKDLAFHESVLRGVIGWYGCDVTPQDFYENFIELMVTIDASDGANVCFQAA
jgi:hypothetical protein